jgi:hypothetical protein
MHERLIRRRLMVRTGFRRDRLSPQVNSLPRDRNFIGISQVPPVPVPSHTSANRRVHTAGRPPRADLHRKS